MNKKECIQSIDLVIEKLCLNEVTQLNSRSLWIYLSRVKEFIKFNIK